MIENDFALMLALLGTSVLMATLFAWRGGDARRDVALLGGSAAGLLGTSAVLLAI